MDTKIKTVSKEISKIIGKQNVLTDELSKIAYGSDAGCYRKTPKLVLKPSTEQEMVDVMKILYKNKLSATFRSAGTSLSGQAISDSVLIQTRGDKWSKTQVLDNGKRIKTQPGITGARLNAILKPYQTKFGPDPASINSALVGGIIANNASGMSCGTHANSYATIESARIVFVDGTLLDTSDQNSRKAFLNSKRELVSILTRLRTQIMSNPDLIEKIKDKYSIKNTTGYGLNSLIDYSDPIDIILHLMVGSEGTLGFISEATFKTVPLLPYRASSMIYFESLEDACNAVPFLKEANVTAIELMDREALRSVENQNGIPDYIKEFNSGVTALLIDLEAKTEHELKALISSTQNALNGFNLVRNFEITTTPKQILEFWKIRKGVFPSVGGMRKPGTSVIIEDIAVKMEHLTQAVLDMREMLDSLDYKDAVIYGHALDGNLHFIFAQDFNDEKELERYENLIQTLCNLIVKKYNGSLKAEHSTGRNMAPFVEFEWGTELYQVMKQIKKAFDELNLLNPDVIITNDTKLHLKDFKPLPLVDETIDQCIECGFCEINCLTTGYTLSARQRIVVQRELMVLKQNNNLKSLFETAESFKYAGEKSCAGDGLCSLSCPLSIDTGVFIKKLRTENHKTNKWAQKWSVRIANNLNLTIKFARFGLNTVSNLQSIIGTTALTTLSKSARFISGNKLPAWNKYMPKSVNTAEVSQSTTNKNKVIYFPSCINQTMGPAKTDFDSKPLMQVTIDVLNRAGYSVYFPEEMSSLCCGTPWESKGFIETADQKSGELEKALLKASENGKYPILCDTSPCIYRMKKVMSDKLELLEPVEFAQKYLLNKLKTNKVDRKIALHVTCSSTKMNLHDAFIEVANNFASNIIVPQEVGCCGFAGDKGFSQPKLNDWALRKLKEQVNGCESGYSNSRTCEIGLSKNSGFHYKSIMYLIDEATRT